MFTSSGSRDADREIADSVRRRRHSTAPRISDQAKSPFTISRFVLYRPRGSALSAKRPHGAFSASTRALFHLSTDTYTYPPTTPVRGTTFTRYLGAASSRSATVSFIWVADSPAQPILFSPLSPLAPFSIPLFCTLSALRTVQFFRFVKC